MRKDKLDELFEDLKDDFDINETPLGHKRRFSEKLEVRRGNLSTSRNWWKPLSIAASVAILISVGLMVFDTEIPTGDLANVSPEMAQTQSFFTAAINKELNTLNNFNAPETQELVTDVLKQIDILETEYEKLRIDLMTSGYDKRVVYAMISNFQRRMDLLNQVIEKIETVKHLKPKTDETTI